MAIHTIQIGIPFHRVTLKTNPNSILAAIFDYERQCPTYDEATENHRDSSSSYYFFDRNPQVKKCI